MPDFVSDFDSGPREPLLQSGVGLKMSNLAGDFDTLQVPDFVSAIDPGTSPESGDNLAVPDFVGDFDPRPGEPLLESRVVLGVPNFACDFGVLQMPDFVSVIDPGPRTPSPESWDVLAMPDLVSDVDPEPGEPLLESGVSSEMLDFACEFDPGPRKLSPKSGDMFPKDVTEGLVKSPVIFTLCTWTLRCRMMPELETDYSQKHRISQVIFIESSKHPNCLGP